MNILQKLRRHSSFKLAKEDGRPPVKPRPLSARELSWHVSGYNVNDNSDGDRLIKSAFSAVSASSYDDSRPQEPQYNEVHRVKVSKEPQPRQSYSPEPHQSQSQLTNQLGLQQSLQQQQEERLQQPTLQKQQPLQRQLQLQQLQQQQQPQQQQPMQQQQQLRTIAEQPLRTHYHTDRIKSEPKSKAVRLKRANSSAPKFRGSSDNKNGPPRPVVAPQHPHDPSQRSRTSSVESERSQDDSAVYSKTRARTRPKRRGESFNLKTSASPTSVRSQRDVQDVPSATESLSSSQTNSSQNLHKMLPTTKSTPSLLYHTQQDGGGAKHTSTLAWQAAEVARSQTSLSNPTGDALTHQSQLKKSLSYTSGRGPTWGVTEIPPWENKMNMNERTRVDSVDEMNQGYNSSSGSGPGASYSQQYASKPPPWTSVAKTQANSNQSDSLQPSAHLTSSATTPVNHQRQYSYPVSMDSVTHPTFSAADELAGRPPSSPRRLATSRYSPAEATNAHEKFASWPVTSGSSEIPSKGLTATSSGSRTYSSWAGSSPHSASEFPETTKYPHAEESMKYISDKVNSNPGYHSDLTRDQYSATKGTNYPKGSHEQTHVDYAKNSIQNTDPNGGNLGSYKTLHSPRLYSETDLSGEGPGKVDTDPWNSYLGPGQNSADLSKNRTRGLPASALNFMVKNKPYYRMDTESTTQPSPRGNVKETHPTEGSNIIPRLSCVSDSQPSGQVPSTDYGAANPFPQSHRDRVHYIPETINENEEVNPLQTPPYGQRERTRELSAKLHEDVMERINDHPADQTSMLRKLSSEFYGAQGRLGMGMTSRLSSSDKEEDGGKFEGPEKRSHGSVNTKEESPALQDKEVFFPPPARSEVEENVEPQRFERRNRYQMSYRKAVSEDREGSAKTLMMQHTRTASASNLPSQPSLPHTTSSHKTQNSFDALFGRKKNKEKKEKKNKSKSRSPLTTTPDPTPQTHGMDKSVSSGQLTQESGSASEDLDGFKLRRTSSEQLRPKNKKAREQEADKHKMSDPEMSQEKRHKAAVDVAQSSGVAFQQQPQPQQPLTKMLNVTPESASSIKQKGGRASSDSDGVFVSNSDSGFAVRFPSGSRSSSTGAASEEQQLRKTHQTALMGYMDRNKGKSRLSTSSMDSGMSGSLLSGNPGTVTSGDKSHMKPVSSWGDEFWKSRSGHAQKSSIQQMSLPPDAMPPSSSSFPYPSPDSTRLSPSSAATHSHPPQELSPPPLLDVTHGVPSTPRPSHSSSSMSPNVVDYSPPPHPWNRDHSPTVPAGITNRVDSLQVSEMTSVGDGSGAEEDTSLTHPKSYEYSDSSGGPNSPNSTMRPTSELNPNPGSYSVTQNQTYVDQDAENPPTLPPRNYRRISEAAMKSRKPIPDPSSLRHPSDKRFASGELHSRSHSTSSVISLSSANAASIGDFDTPKEDYYADQLRLQARRITQSQTSLLHSRYAPKTLLDTKTSISVSRPVESLPQAQEAKAPPIPPHIPFASSERINTSSPEAMIPVSASPDTGSADQKSMPRSTGATEVLGSVGLDVDKHIGLQTPLSSNHSYSAFSRGSNVNQPSPQTENSISFPLQNTSVTSANFNISRPKSFPDDTPPPPPLPKTAPPELDLNLKTPYKEVILGSGRKESPKENLTNASSTPLSGNHAHRTNFTKRRSASREVDSVTSPMTTPEAVTPLAATRIPPVPVTCVDPPAQETIVRTSPPAQVTVTNSKKVFSSPSTDTAPVKAAWRHQQAFKNVSPVEQTTYHHHQQTNGHSVSEMDKSTQNNSSLGSQSPEPQSFSQKRPENSNFENVTHVSRETESLSESITTPKMKTERTSEILRTSPESAVGKDDTSPNSADTPLSISPVVSGDKLTDTVTPVMKDTPEKYKKMKRADKIPREGKKRSPKSNSKSSSPKERKSSSPKPEKNTKGVDKSECVEGEEKHTQPPGPAPIVCHVKQKSQEEIAYEQQAAIVASQIRDKDRRLSEVILPPAEHKKARDFVLGLFETKGTVTRRTSVAHRKTGESKVVANDNNNGKDNHSSEGQSSEDQPINSTAPSDSWRSPSITSLHTNITNQDFFTINPDAPLQCQKEELVGRLEKKLEILQEEKTVLAEEMIENKKLGKQVNQVVERKCQSPQEVSKYKLYVDELEQVTYLLLKLSARLAKAENAVFALPANASSAEKTLLTRKRDELHEKHEDAKDLKEGIDRRSQQVSGFLLKYLTSEEYQDYDYFIKNKSQLTIEQHDIEERMREGEEQLKALKQSMTESSS